MSTKPFATDAAHPSTTWYNATRNDHTVYPSLSHDIDCDVAIVGAGHTGVATAVELSERGISTVLLDANHVGWGATGRNGGQVTGSLSGDVAMLRQLTKTMGSAAEDYVWSLRWRGQDIITDRIAQYGIACDLKRGHVHAAYQRRHLGDLTATLAEAERFGMGDDLTLLSATDVRDFVGTEFYHGGLYNRRNLHLHSLNLCLGEAAAAASLGTKIYEQTPVFTIDYAPPGASGATLQTPHGKVRAQRVLLAGNAYHRLARPRLKGILFPASLANMTTEVLDDAVVRSINPRDVAVYDTRFVLDYYRITADNRLMFGGGTNYSGRDPRSVANALTPAMIKTFPQLKHTRVAYQWTGRAGITINRIPQLGTVTPDVFYAQGYSGHGIATSHIVAQVMAAALAGNTDEFDRLAALRQVRIPAGDVIGQGLLTLGMWYYQLRERLW